MFLKLVFIESQNEAKFFKGKSGKSEEAEQTAIYSCFETPKISTMNDF